MKSKVYYIIVAYSLFLAGVVFIIGFTTNWHLISSAVFSILLMIYVSWQAIKNFRKRSRIIIFDNKRVFAGIGLMLLIAGILIFIGTTFKEKPLTPAQKERLIVK